MDVHYVRLGDFKLPAESLPGRRVPKRKSQPHSRFNAPDWVWYYVLRHSVTRGAEETGIYSHNRVFATSLAVGVVNLKDVHGREPQVLVLGTAVSVGARNQVHLCVGPSAEADLMGRRAQQSTEPLADHDVYLVWSSRRRIVYMSAGLATVIRPRGACWWPFAGGRGLRRQLAESHPG